MAPSEKMDKDPRLFPRECFAISRPPPQIAESYAPDNAISRLLVLKDCTSKADLEIGSSCDDVSMSLENPAKVLRHHGCSKKGRYERQGTLISCIVLEWSWKQ